MNWDTSRRRGATSGEIGQVAGSSYLELEKAAWKRVLEFFDEGLLPDVTAWMEEIGPLVTTMGGTNVISYQATVRFEIAAKGSG